MRQSNLLRRLASFIVLVAGALVVLGTDDEGLPTLERIEVVHFDAGEGEQSYQITAVPAYTIGIEVRSGATLTWSNEPADVPVGCVVRTRTRLAFDCYGTYAEQSCRDYCADLRVTVKRTDVAKAGDYSMTIELASLGPGLMEIEVNPD